MAEPAHDTRIPPNYPFPVLKLPDELILAVADFLHQECQVLFSLSCKRVRTLLNRSLDLSLHDPAVKLLFLQCLEADYPEHLTCRLCCSMFKWRHRRSHHYRCPDLERHPGPHCLASYACCMRIGRNFWVTREIVDLTFRAHEWGEDYGLPLSFLRATGTMGSCITGNSEARFVDGQLLLAIRWELDPECQHDLPLRRQFFNSAVCLHAPLGTWTEEFFQAAQDVIEDVPNMIGWQERAVGKCNYCQTDCQLYVRKSHPSDRNTIVLDVWQNYGRRNKTTLLDDMMFDQTPCSSIDHEAMSQRDLRAVFESYGSVCDGVGS